MAATSRGLKGIIDGLMGRSALSGVASPFESFGPLAAASAGALAQPKGWGGLLDGIKTATFTVDEARRRVSDFISGAFKPRSSGEFIAYIKENLLGLEKRAYGTGKSTTYLVDKISGEAVPSAAVDRRKLSDRAVDRVLARDAVADQRLQAEAAIAQTYRSQLAPMLRQAVTGGKPPFADWADIGFTLPSALKGRGLVVRNGESYIGVQIGTCDTSPEKTRALLTAKRAELVAQYGPKAQFVFDPAMTPGSPILVADDKTLVRARMVHPSLAADRLEKAFGTGFTDHYRSLVKEPLGGPNVVSLDKVQEFRAKFAKKKDVAPEGSAFGSPEASASPAPQAVGGFGFADPGVTPAAPAPRTFDPRHVVIRMSDDGRPTIWHAKRGRELADVPSMHFLPKGEYEKVDACDMPIGKIRVDGEGNVAHLTMDNREHNLDGPSFEPSPGSDKVRRWAIEGTVFSNFRGFKARREQLLAQEDIAVEVVQQAIRQDRLPSRSDDEHQGPRFGFH